MTCPACQKSYEENSERHVPQVVEETRGVMVIRYARGCKLEKL